MIRKLASSSTEVPAVPGDLGILQATCQQALDRRTLLTTEALSGHGSILVLRPSSSEMAEHWLAHRCRTQASATRVIVSEEHGPALDETLRAHGVPACGFGEASTLRPDPQALPLTLETLWDPIEFSRLLEFMMHPVGPFSSKTRRVLGSAFGQQPGIGGSKWIDVREKVRTDLGEDVCAHVGN